MPRDTAFLSSFLDRLSGVVWWQLAAALIVYLGVQALRAKAWEQVLELDVPDLEVRYPKIAAAYIAGSGANALIPAHGGDLVKVFLAKRVVRGITYPTLAASILVLIAVDTIVAASFVLWGVVTGNLPGPQELLDGNGRLAGFAFAHPAALVIIVALTLCAIALLVRYALRRLEHRAADLKRSLKACRNLRMLTRVVPWQLSAWLLQLPCYWLFLSAFAIHPSLTRTATVQAASGLAVALPIAGGAVASQALLVAAFAGRVGAGKVIAFFVGMRFAVAVVNLLLGLVALLFTMHTLDLRSVLGSVKASRLRSKVPLLPVSAPAVVPVRIQVDEEPTS
jgi:hypothetical protein